MYLTSGSRPAVPSCGRKAHCNAFAVKPGSVRCAGGEKSRTSPSAAPPDKAAAGRMIYKPMSYTELVRDASAAIEAGFQAGLTRLEVEFPPIAGLDSYKGASDSYIDANVQLALGTAKRIHELTGKSVVILLPDEAEFQRSSELSKTTLSMLQGVSMSYLTEGRSQLMRGLRGLFGMDDDSKAPATSSSADVHIVVNVSTIELVDVERYSREVAKDGSAMVLFNCELDTLRADLGLFGFPSKDLQYQFLCYFKPVFYIRQRDYSKTVNVAPFVVNYSGALFREFPGPWQVMLRQDNGEYACVAEDNTRYTLGEVKDELMEAMGLNTEADGSAMQFLRRGYKTATWWEEDETSEKSNLWRT